jgi:hypothetical protein
MAALLQLKHMPFTPDAHSVTLGWLKNEMVKVDFVDIQDDQDHSGLNTPGAR